MIPNEVKVGRKVYVTRWALTRGILEANIVSIRSATAKHVWLESEHWAGRCPIQEWYFSIDDAKAKVREMIAAKRKSIEKQLKRLDDLEQSL